MEALPPLGLNVSVQIDQPPTPPQRSEAAVQITPESSGPCGTCAPISITSFPMPSGCLVRSMTRILNDPFFYKAVMSIFQSSPLSRDTMRPAEWSLSDSEVDGKWMPLR